jgi:hypothetical protein
LILVAYSYPRNVDLGYRFSNMQASGNGANYERLYQRLEKLETAVRSQQKTDLLARLEELREGCKKAEENSKGFATFKKLCAYV